MYQIPIFKLNFVAAAAAHVVADQTTNHLEIEIRCCWSSENTKKIEPKRTTTNHHQKTSTTE